MDNHSNPDNNIMPMNEQQQQSTNETSAMQQKKQLQDTILLQEQIKSTSTAIQHEEPVPLSSPSSPSKISLSNSALVASSHPTGITKPKKTTINRCLKCRTKVGLMGFKCKCEHTFCGSCRYPEEHNCSFDYKAAGKAQLQKSLPKVAAAKVASI